MVNETGGERRGGGRCRTPRSSATSWRPPFSTLHDRMTNLMSYIVGNHVCRTSKNVSSLVGNDWPVNSLTKYPKS